MTPLVARLDPYAAAALEAECQAVAKAPNGTRNHRLNEAAFSLGQLVGAGKIDAHAVTVSLLAAASSAGLTGAESARTLESGLAAGLRAPRAVA